MAGMGDRRTGLKNNPLKVQVKEKNVTLGTIKASWMTGSYSLYNVEGTTSKVGFKYSYCSDNPINRIDPDGMTDFTLNQNTGAVTQIGDANKDPDRVLKTKQYGKHQGEIKYKKNGEAKVAIGGIEKGILSNGMNLKSNDNVINVGGANQPSVKGFESFALNLSNYVNKEVGGFYLSNKGTSDVSHIYLGGYGNNTDQSTRSGFNLYNVRPDLFGHVDPLTSFHTHLSRFNDNDRLRPSGQGGDLDFKETQTKNGVKNFLIITDPEPLEHPY